MYLTLEDLTPESGSVSFIGSARPSVESGYLELCKLPYFKLTHIYKVALQASQSQPLLRVNQQDSGDHWDICRLGSQIFVFHRTTSSRLVNYTEQKVLKLWRSSFNCVRHPKWVVMYSTWSETVKGIFSYYVTSSYKLEFYNC